VQRLLKIAGVALMLGAVFGGCGTVIVAFAFFEPPHPEWAFPLAAPPEARGKRTMNAGEYTVRVTQGRCTLAVWRANDNSLVGRDDRGGGNECSVSGRAAQGEVWSFDATSTDPAATLEVRPDPELMPRPFRTVLLGWLALFPLGVYLRRKGRRAPPEPAAAPPGGQA
jgi:hypothetical protein